MAGVFEAIVGAMRLHADVAKVQRHACLALRGLACLGTRLLHE